MLPPPPTSTLFPYTTLFRSTSAITRRIVVAINRNLRARAGRDLQHQRNQMRFGIVPLATSFRSEEHTSELQSLRHLVCRLLLEKKKTSANTMFQIQTRRYLD